MPSAGAALSPLAATSARDVRRGGAGAIAPATRTRSESESSPRDWSAVASWWMLLGDFGRGDRIAHVYSCADRRAAKSDANAVETAGAVVEL